MTNRVVPVPASLLLCSTLPAPARLLWMVARLCPKPASPNTSWLSAHTGLARNTVLRGLTLIAAHGWEPPPSAPGKTVPMPASLLTDRRLSPQSRVLYGILLLTPGFRHPGGRFTCAELAELAGASRNTVDQALKELVRAEWILLERAHRLAPVFFELTFPGRERAEIALAAAQRRLSKKDPSFGELLMREYLSLLIDSDQYEDSASPGFLLNPRTQELLELDRYYPPNVAFELNGPQHFRSTERFTPPEVAVQRERDLIKMGICLERGITLVVVLPEDVTLDGMRRKVGNLLPLRDLTGYELLIDHLESESDRYRRSMERI